MIKYLQILIIILIFATAQGVAKDTIAVCKIYNTLHISPDVMEFDLQVHRTSDKWDSWVNGTFQITFDDPDYQFNEDRIEIERLGETDLDIGMLSGNDLPVDKYIINQQVLDGRISINVHGPEAYDNTITVPADSFIKIDRFRIISKDGSYLPKSMIWVKPYDYYQATAYKLQYDSTRKTVEQFYRADDNIEQQDRGDHAVKYALDDSPEPQMILEYFYATYMGGKNVMLEWKTEEEAYNKGFILKRGIMPIGRSDPEKINYNQYVAAYTDPGYPAQVMTGMGTAKPGKEYKYEFDTISYRSIQYCYTLQYEDFYGEIHDLATACVPIPNAVITFAQANPNPFGNNTKVQYIVDDDVIMSVDLYDLSGKHMETLMKDQYVEKGKYDDLVIEMPEYASAGLYDLVFIAKPVEDTSVEISRAVVKLQLVK